jgi:hypothetical protein
VIRRNRILPLPILPILRILPNLPNLPILPNLPNLPNLPKFRMRRSSVALAHTRRSS